MQLKTQIALKNVSAKDFASRVGESESMMSRYCNYKCLPIPATMDKICKELNCNVTDIYQKEEIMFLKNKKRTHDNLDCYKLTVKLPVEYHQYFNSEFLKQCGYYSLKELVDRRIMPHLKKKKESIQQQTENSLQNE